MTRNDALAIHRIMVGKLTNCWQLSAVAKAIGVELSSLSFGDGCEEVELFQTELGVMTGYEEDMVSDGVTELMKKGLLHRRGKRGRARIFRLLPNAELIEPAPRLDREAAERMRALVRERNLRRVLGDDPGGIPTHRGMLPYEERAASDLASASAARALADDQTRPAVLRAGESQPAELQAVESSPAVLRGSERPADLRAEVERLLKEPTLPPIIPAADAAPRVGSDPSRRLGLDPSRERELDQIQVGELDQIQVDGRARVRTRDVYVNEDVRRNVSCGWDVDVRQAYSAVKQHIGPEEFNKWERSWRKRCRLAPLQVLGAVRDALEYAAGNDIDVSMGALIYNRARQLARDAGITAFK